jgi:hypothetical protein
VGWGGGDINISRQLWEPRTKQFFTLATSFLARSTAVPTSVGLCLANWQHIRDMHLECRESVEISRAYALHHQPTLKNTGVPAILLEPADSESPTQLPPASAYQSLNTGSLLVPADSESALPAAVSMSRPAVAGVLPAQRSFLRLRGQSPAIFIVAMRPEASDLHCGYAARAQ